MNLKNQLISSIRSGVAEQRKKSIMNLLMNSTKPLTDQEIRYKLGYNDPNCVRPRRNELVKDGLVFPCGKRECQITHRLSQTWHYNILSM